MNLKFIVFITIIKTFFSFLYTTSSFSAEKLCINCKHYLKSDFNNKFGKCDKYPIVDKLTGEKIHIYASIVRKSPFLCGKNAQGFEEVKKDENKPFDNVLDIEN